jgi:mannose/fructose/N-acetylgalactosamine-specific phosphotransferase system component IIB
MKIAESHTRSQNLILTEFFHINIMTTQNSCYNITNARPERAKIMILLTTKKTLLKTRE